MVGHRNHIDGLAKSDGAVRISMASLESGIVSPPAMKDDREEGARVRIRIAAGDIEHGEPDPRGRMSQQDHFWKMNSHRRADETTAGGVRISAAMLAVNDVAGPRITNP
jgi:hypothetical protein